MNNIKPLGQMWLVEAQTFVHSVCFLKILVSGKKNWTGPRIFLPAMKFDLCTPALNQFHHWYWLFKSQNISKLEEKHISFPIQNTELFWHSWKVFKNSMFLKIGFLRNNSLEWMPILNLCALFFPLPSVRFQFWWKHFYSTRPLK